MIIFAAVLAVKQRVLLWGVHEADRVIVDMKENTLFGGQGASVC